MLTSPARLIAKPASAHARRSTRGGALLAVLWLVAALSAIALTIASTVRAEVELSTLHFEGVRAYFLARAGVERAALWVQWGAGMEGTGSGPRYYQRGMRSLAFQFPTGDVVVDVIPESSKLDINRIPVEELAMLFQALGSTVQDAEALAVSVDHWRNPATGFSALDSFYLSRRPSFPARRASLENVEELLLVRGMTPEMYYGSFVPVGTAGTFVLGEPEEALGFAGLPEVAAAQMMAARRSLVWRGGLRDCVSVFGAVTAVDVNWAEPAVMLALGVPPQVVNAIVTRRQQLPFQDDADLQSIGFGNIAGLSRLRVGGRSQFTLRATARPRNQDGRLSDLARTVAAVVDLNEVSGDRPFTTLRWYDTAWKQ
ncbi:MAG: general secretion pathway protein GspK [Bryobacterales bacterium]|nr:general secretion pathway protein GspK [Bryobacterales bacterium]